MCGKRLLVTLIYFTGRSWYELSPGKVKDGAEIRNVFVHVLYGSYLWKNKNASNNTVKAVNRRIKKVRLPSVYL